MKVAIAILIDTPQGTVTAARLRIDLDIIAPFSAGDRAQQEEIEAKACDAVIAWLNTWKSAHRHTKRAEFAGVKRVNVPIKAIV